MIFYAMGWSKGTLFSGKPLCSYGSGTSPVVKHECLGNPRTKSASKWEHGGFPGSHVDYQRAIHFWHKKSRPMVGCRQLDLESVARAMGG